MPQQLTLLSDNQLKDWLIEKHLLADEIDKMDDSFEQAGALIELMEDIEGLYKKLPEDQINRCCSMALEEMTKRDQLELAI